VNFHNYLTLTHLNQSDFEQICIFKKNVMKIIQNLFEIFYPKICLSCQEYLADQEELICVWCRHDLPLTNFCHEPENYLERSFYGRVPLAYATALFYFSKKGKVQQLTHTLKYQNQQKLGGLFGDWLGEDILESNRFHGLDCIVPVPLHKKKQSNRGYNQLSEFGKRLAEKLGIPFIENNLVKTYSSNSQTHKLRWERWKNVDEIFRVTQPDQFENKHLLLIDDIVTTGATIEACFAALDKECSLEISLACMAYTK